jgi:RecA-family ATPase
LGTFEQNYTDSDLEYFERTQRTQEAQAAPLAPISAAELQRADLPPLKFVVEGLLPQGLGILASPPKYGKSWLVLDLCLSVAAGKPFLGRPTHRGGCLYLALEDSFHRLQERMNKVLGGGKAPGNFTLSTRCADLSSGLTGQLEAHVKAHPDTALIVIDTFQKIRGAAGKETAYSADYREVGQLKQFADRCGLCLLLVHHLRKMDDNADVFNRISGTNGIAGAADTMLVLSRLTRGDADTTFHAIGRDIESDETVLSFDKASCRWRVIGSAEERAEQAERERHEADPLVRTIKALVKESPCGCSYTAGELMVLCVEKAGVYPADTPTTLSRAIRAMAQKLYEYDEIVYKAPAKNGSNGTRKHTFYKAGAQAKLEL